MYMSKLKIKTFSVDAWRSLCWWPDLSDCLVTSSISQGRPKKKPADHDNCWDDGEARREDFGQGRYDLPGVYLFLCPSVCLSVCYASENYWSEVRENFTRDASVSV